MPMLPAQSVKFASLAGAILLSIALIIHLHLLGSRSLPSTTSSAPTRPTLPLTTSLDNIAERTARIEFSVAGEDLVLWPCSSKSTFPSSSFVQVIDVE